MKSYICNVIKDKDGSCMIILPEELRFPDDIKEVYIKDYGEYITISPKKS